MLKDSVLLQRRWVRITPHIVDTLLLLSGITLIYQYQIYPQQHSWLMGKLIALLLYIVLGSIALKRGKTKSMRLVAWILALVVFSYMLLAAISHHPFPPSRW